MKMSLHTELGINGVRDYKDAAPMALAENRRTNFCNAFRAIG